MPKYVSGSTGPGSVIIEGQPYSYRSGARYDIFEHGFVSISFNPRDYATGMLYNIKTGELTIDIHGGAKQLSMSEDSFENIFDSIFGGDAYNNAKTRLGFNVSYGNTLFIRSRRSRVMKRKTRRSSVMNRKSRRSRVMKRKSRRNTH